jgi:hypothetical protein
MQAMRLNAWSSFMDLMFVPPFFYLFVFKLPITSFAETGARTMSRTPLPEVFKV